MNSRILLTALFALGLPANALACGAYPAGTNTNDLVLGMVANGTNIVSYTSVANAGTSRQGMIVYNRSTNSLLVCDGSAWRTLAAAGGVAAAGSSGQIQFNNAGVLGADTGLFWDNTNKRLGFGTAAPSYIVSFEGNTTQTVGMERHTIANTAGNSLTVLAGGATSGATDKNGGDLVLSSGTASGTGTSKIEFKTHPAGTTGTADTTATTAMTILGSGNVGIGTGSPSHQLDVRGSSPTVIQARSTVSNSRVDMRLFAPGTSSFQYITFGDDSAFDRGIIEYSHSADAMRFYTSGYNSGAADLAIDSAGNVGVGTTAPVSLLHVDNGFITSGRYGSTGALILRSASGTSAAPSAVATLGGLAYISFRGYDGSAYREGGAITSSTEDTFTSTSSPASIRILTTPAGTTTPVERVRITASGNVGIGTTAPNQGKLEVKGGTVCVDTDNDDNATSCITTESDARLKKNVRPLDVSLDTFMKLRPVSFDWKHDDAEVLKHYPLISRFAGHPHSIGMIAQEVQALVPDAILPETLGDEGVQYLQLDYTKLVPVLIKALQDVKREKDAEIDALTKRIEVLERILLTPEASAASAKD